MVALLPDAARVEVSASQPVGKLTFTGTTADGLRIRRTLEFRADSYRVGATLQIDAPGRGSRAPWTCSCTGRPRSPSRVPPRTSPGTRSARARMGGTSSGASSSTGRDADPEAHEAPAPALKDTKDSPGGPELKDPLLVADAVVSGERRWAALEDDYFIAALVGRPGTAVTRGRARDVAQAGLVFREVQIAAGQTWEADGRPLRRAEGVGAAPGARRGAGAGAGPELRALSLGRCSPCGGSACRSCGS